MDNDDVKTLLLNIRRDCSSPYPFPDDTDVDTRYCMALGLIVGIVTEALHSVQQNRPANFQKFVPS